MRGTLGGLYCRRNLGIRGRKKPGDLLGEDLVGREPGELALPEIEIAPRQCVEIARAAASGVVVSGDHAGTIDHRGHQGVFAGAKAALSHCGIGATLTNVQ
jgi:hypothetical protein